MNTTNQEQIDYWDKRAGPTWVELQERLDALLEPLSAAGLQAADVQSGERVLDVGCGCGDTSIALQGLGADVLGVDVSGPMLEHARKRDSSVQYRQADAASTDFGGAFDLVFSRFGVMFISEPVAAFRNLHGALKSTGRLLFVCWQAPSANPWMSIAGRAIAPFLPAPDGPGNPRARYPESAGGGFVHLPDHTQWQPERAHHHGGRAGSRPYPGQGAPATFGRAGLHG